MSDTAERHDEVDEWTRTMLIYKSALKSINTRLDILSDEFRHVHQYNPIEHIKSRIKTPESIVKKLHRYEKDVTISDMVAYVNDIAGIRIICSFIPDIYRIAGMIENQSDIKILNVKDYIQSPKPNGYRSYHMLVTIPVFLSDEKLETKVEIQICTIAMDFWASLEHKIHYKFKGNAPDSMWSDLKDCADMVSLLDQRMQALNDTILHTSAPHAESDHSKIEQEIERLSV